MSLLKVPYNPYQSYFSIHFDIYKVQTNDILELMKIFKFFQKNKKETQPLVYLYFKIKSYFEYIPEEVTISCWLELPPYYT